MAKRIEESSRMLPIWMPRFSVWIKLLHNLIFKIYGARSKCQGIKLFEVYGVLLVQRFTRALGPKPKNFAQILALEPAQKNFDERYDHDFL